jgi:fatty-acyl-CoA synthase
MTDPNLTIRDLADLAAIESVPLAQRLTGNNTYDILSAGAAIDPDRVAITYLPTGSPDDVPVTYSFRDLIGNVTRAANLFASLGVGPTMSSPRCCPRFPKPISPSGAPRRPGSPASSIRCSPPITSPNC